MVPFFTGFGKRERFKPDLFVEDGFSLEPYGFQGSVVSLPGHSQGSVGVVTVDGSLFCGDLFENTKTPTLNSLMDDPLAGKASMDKLTSMQIQMVHPGHGEPFLYNVLL
jgi:glyoxylase-like metal-dependent hydrolase (beta-lactamase superfamily II)